MNSVKQLSKLWFRMKARMFGANDCASILGYGFQTRAAVIENKVSMKEQEFSPEQIERMKKGTIYEDVVRNRWAERHHKIVKPTGLKVHNVLKFLTASPDGYCRDGDFLVEFKVRSELSDGSVPYKYWIQMQIQMEVWDKMSCAYCENIVTEFPTEHEYLIETKKNPGHGHGVLTDDTGNTRYWRLTEFRELVVERNQLWFENTCLPQLSTAWDEITKGRMTQGSQRSTRSNGIDAMMEPLDNPDILFRKKSRGKKRKAPQETSQQKRQKIDDGVYPYMISNFIRKDPLLDWLGKYGNPDEKDATSSPFLSMIRRKNREFSSLVKTFIKTTYSHLNGFIYDVDENPVEPLQLGTVSIEPDFIKVTDENVERTKKAMKEHVPVIFNPCFNVKVPSYAHPISGRSDMIVLNKYIDQVFGQEVSADDENKYSLISFRYATINQTADGEHMLNNDKQKVYKAHLWLLNAALTLTQEYASTRAFVVGRKYERTRKGIKHKIDNAFGGIGVVDFSENDLQYEEMCQNALEWVAKIRTEESSSWNPREPQEDLSELYPNMKNHNDYPWHGYKLDLAREIRDITLMHKCGPRVRQYAHDQGVTQWTDLTEDSIVYKKGVMKQQICDFLSVNIDTEQKRHGTTPALTRKGLPCFEVYGDFEGTGNMYDDFSTFPKAGDKAMVYLIGLVIRYNINNTTEYRSFIADKLEKKSEKDIFDQMFTCFDELCIKYEQDFVPFYYWSNAENYMLNRALGASEFSKRKESMYMVDLCKQFREAKIIFPGQFGYGLKEVAKIMYNAGLIQTMWKETDISSGVNAMIEGIKNYECRQDERLKRQFFADVVEYNYVDCKVMEEMLDYFRREENEINVNNNDNC